MISPASIANSLRLPPLVARELLVGSRHAWTYWLRLLTALGAVSVLVVLALTGHSRLGRTDGFSLFAGSVVVLFLIASLNGLRSTTDCISAERRQGTLVLLFLAGLKLDTVLVSKLVTHSLRNAWALLATLPVLGLCLLLGGVSGGMFLRGALAILAAAWLSLTVGLEQSCRNKGEHQAFSDGLRLLLGMNLLPLVSPASLILSVFAGSLFWKAYYWMNLLGTCLAGLAFWSTAKHALANNWQEAPPEDDPAGSAPPAPPPPLPAAHLKRPPRRCGNTPPAYWLFARYGDSRQASPLAIGIAFVVSVGFFSLVSLLLADPDMVVLIYAWGMAPARITQMLAMAKIAPQSFGDITRHGALEILQTTPVTLKEIVHAARDFLFVHFRRGVLPMLALDGLMVLLLSLKIRHHDESAWRLAWVLLVQNSLFLSGLWAMGNTGIWLGLKQRSLTRASVSLVFFLLVLPALLYNFCPAHGVVRVGLVLAVLVPAYCLTALLMRRSLNRLVER